MINEEENNKMTKSSVCSRQDAAADDDARRGGRRQGRITCNQEYLNNNLNDGQSQNGPAALARLLDSTSSAVEAEKATSSTGDDKITVVDDQLYSANFDDEAEAASEKEEEEMMMRRQVNSMLENTASQLYSLAPPPSSSLVNGLTSVTDEARLRASPAPLSSQPPLNLSLQSHSHAKSTLSRDGFVTNKRYQTLRDNMHSQSQLTSCYDEVYQVADEDDDDELDEDDENEEEERYDYKKREDEGRKKEQDETCDRKQPQKEVAQPVQAELVPEVASEATVTTTGNVQKKKLEDMIKKYEKSKANTNKVLNAAELIGNDGNRIKTVNKYVEEENLLKAFAGEVRSSSSSLSTTPRDAKVSNNLSAYMSDEARALITKLRNDSGPSKSEQAKPEIKSVKEVKVDEPAELLDGLIMHLASKKQEPKSTSIQYNNYLGYDSLAQYSKGPRKDTGDEEKELTGSDEDASADKERSSSYSKRDYIPVSTTSNISKMSMMNLNDMLSSAVGEVVDETANQEKSYPFSQKSKTSAYSVGRRSEELAQRTKFDTAQDTSASKSSRKSSDKEEIRVESESKLAKSKSKKSLADKKSSDPVDDYKIESSINELSQNLVEKSAISEPSRHIPKSSLQYSGAGTGIYHAKFPSLVYDVSNSTIPSLAPSRYAFDTKSDNTLPSSNVEPAPSKTSAKTTRKSNRTNKSTANGPNSSLQSSANADNNEERQKYSQHYSEDLNELLSFIESSAPAQTSQQSEESKKSKRKPKNKKKNEPSVVQQQTASAALVPAPSVKTSASSVASSSREKEDKTQQTYSQSNSSSSVSSDKSIQDKDEAKSMANLPEIETKFKDVVSLNEKAAFQMAEMYADTDATLTSEAVNEDDFVTVTGRWTKSRKQPKEKPTTTVKNETTKNASPLQSKLPEESSKNKTLAKQTSIKSTNSFTSNVKPKPTAEINVKAPLVPNKSANSLKSLQTNSAESQSKQPATTSLSHTKSLNQLDSSKSYAKSVQKADSSIPTGTGKEFSVVVAQEIANSATVTENSALTVKVDSNVTVQTKQDDVKPKPDVINEKAEPVSEAKPAVCLENDQVKQVSKLEDCKSASSTSLENNVPRKSKKYDYLIKRNSNSVVFLDEFSDKDPKSKKDADTNKQDQTTSKVLEGISFGFLSSDSDSERKGFAQEKSQHQKQVHDSSSRSIKVEFIGESMVRQDQQASFVNTTTSSSLVIRKDKQRKLKTKTNSKTSAKTPNESEISSGIERRHSSSNDSNVSSTPSRSSSSDSKDDSNQYHPTRSNKQRLKRSQRTNKASFRYKYAPDGGNKEDDDCSTADETNYSNVYSHQSYSVVSEEKSHDQDAAYMDGFDESENQMDDKEQAYMHPGHYYSPQHIIPPPLQAPLQGHQVPYMAYGPSHGQIYPPGVDAPPLPPHQLMNMPGYPAYVPASYNPAQMAPQPNHAVANTTAAYAYNQQVHLASYQTIQASYQANYAYVPHPSSMPGQPQPNYVQPVPYYVQPMQAVQGGHPATPYFVYRPVAHYPTAPAVAASNSQHHHAYYQQYYNYPMYQNYVPVNNVVADAADSSVPPPSTPAESVPATENIDSPENPQT